MQEYVIVFGLFVQLLLTISVYDDVKHREDHTGLWVTTTFLFSILGTVFYLLNRTD